MLANPIAVAPPLPLEKIKSDSRIPPLFTLSPFYTHTLSSDLLIQSQMTPSELSYILLRDEYHVLDISPEDFSRLESYIGRRAYVFKEFYIRTGRR